MFFLDDVRPPLRKAAAKAVTLLNVKSNKGGGLGLSHKVAFTYRDDEPNPKQVAINSNF